MVSNTYMRFLLFSLESKGLHTILRQTLDLHFFSLKYVGSTGILCSSVAFASLEITRLEEPPAFFMYTYFFMPLSIVLIKSACLAYSFKWRRSAYHLPRKDNTVVTKTKGEGQLPGRCA